MSNAMTTLKWICRHNFYAIDNHLMLLKDSNFIETLAQTRNDETCSQFEWMDESSDEKKRKGR